MNNTNRYDQLAQEVQALYAEKRPEREDWADYLAEYHIGQVADQARAVAERFGGDPELAACGGILHDVADAEMSRFDPRHTEASLNIARELLRKHGFSDEEIAIIVDDGIVFHSCRDGNYPKTLEGGALAAGDALVHLTSDFYPWARQKKLDEGKSPEEINEWATKKINRDYNEKLIYDELKVEMQPMYESLLGDFR